MMTAECGVMNEEPVFSFITHHSSFIISSVVIHTALVRNSRGDDASQHGARLFAPVSRRVLMK
jgi:hypothetical protein